ncbi:hypothetical protein B0H11DRAFT_734293 [Mycena galericulata]|nr:hypothetical protein B0H11DRAFT_734293 [Mycena galericulata]
MYWNERNSTPFSESSSAGSSAPSPPSSDHSFSAPNNDFGPELQSETTKEVLQSVLSVRKTWKTLRGGETVWPLELEAALLEGLERYQPDDSRETRMLGRYPRRNRFISDYILEKTGKRRSPKQVGSRLQQLRESCSGQKLMKLLSPFREPAYPESGDSALNSPVSPSIGDSLLFQTTSSRHTVMYIDILPERSPDKTYTSNPSPWSDHGDVIHASDRPRHLGTINPTVSFTSPTPILAHSRFTVYSEDLILHAETVPLSLLKEHTLQSQSKFLYTTKLVPKYWQVILDSPDPTRFTIFQEVLKDDNPTLVFSATYKFSYPQNPVSSSSFGMPNESNISRLDIQSSDSGFGYDELTPLARYPMYENGMWDPPLASRLREHSTMQRYHNPSNNDCSSLYLPSKMPTYVS